MLANTMFLDSNLVHIIGMHNHYLSGYHLKLLWGCVF